MIRLCASRLHNLCSTTNHFRQLWWKIQQSCQKSHHLARSKKNLMSPMNVQRFKTRGPAHSRTLWKISIGSNCIRSWALWRISPNSWRSGPAHSPFNRSSWPSNRCSPSRPRSNRPIRLSRCSRSKRAKHYFQGIDINARVVGQKEVEKARKSLRCWCVIIDL